jgi:hypothetical protein
MQEIDKLLEEKKEFEAKLATINGRIHRIQKDCKHPNSKPSQGPEPSLIDTYCPDCKLIW